MTGSEYAQMVEYLADRFPPGRMGAWDAGAIVHDFLPFDADLVWEVLLGKLDADPSIEWPPTPPALRAGVLDRLRHDRPAPAIPETTAKYGWKEHCMRTYGEVITFQEAVERAAGVR